MTRRFLVACDTCRAQYDVTDVAPGSRFACTCGQAVVARHRAPHTPRALQCSNCGGRLRDGARCCDYCSSEITLEERRLTSVCPGCFARMASDARFCMECGVQVEVHRPAAPAVGSSCPRCRCAMHPRTVEEAPLLECPTCAGYWMEPTHFDYVTRRARTEARMVTEPQGVLVKRAPDAHGTAYLPCPECDDYMVRRNFGGRSGVILDVCRHHGVWLDHGELPRIVRWIREGNDPDAAARAAATRETTTTTHVHVETRSASWTTTRHGGAAVDDLFGFLGGMFAGDLFG